jgi:hypothetical protein
VAVVVVAMEAPQQLVHLQGPQIQAVAVAAQLQAQRTTLEQADLVYYWLNINFSNYILYGTFCAHR